MRCGKWASALMILLVSSLCSVALGAPGSAFGMPSGPGHSFMFRPQAPFHRFDHRGGFHSFQGGGHFGHHRHSSVLLIGVPLFWPEEDIWPAPDVSPDDTLSSGTSVLYYCYDPAGYYPAVMDCPSGWHPVVVGGPR